MSRGSKIILLIIGGLIVIGLVVYYIVIPVFSSGAPATNNNVNANLNASLPAANVPANANQPAVNVPLPAETAPAAQQAGAARTIALTFAERLSTFTNQNNLANLNDLQAISTPAVWSYLNGEYRNGLLKNMPDAKTYYAVTGTALNANIAPSSDDQVSATVQVQRVETGTVSQTSYSTLDLVLKKVDGAWLVARVNWEK